MWSEMVGYVLTLWQIPWEEMDNSISNTKNFLERCRSAKRMTCEYLILDTQLLIKILKTLTLLNPPGCCLTSHPTLSPYFLFSQNAWRARALVFWEESSTYPSRIISNVTSSMKLLYVSPSPPPLTNRISFSLQRHLVHVTFSTCNHWPHVYGGEQFCFLSCEPFVYTVFTPCYPQHRPHPWHTTDPQRLSSKWRHPIGARSQHAAPQSVPLHERGQIGQTLFHVKE